MKKIALLLLVLTSTFINSEAKSKPITIPFELTPNGHILIEAEVNGVKGNFIFDTGAGMNLLIQKFADKIIDLEKTNHFHTGHRATGEALSSDIWNSKLLEIGAYKFEKELFATYDMDFPIDGLISLTPFANQPITIDFTNKQLIVETKKSLKKRKKNADFEMPLKIHWDKGITIDIATDVQLNDTLSLVVNLDSGAGFGVYRFNDRYMQNLGIDTSNIKSEIKESIFTPNHKNTFYFTTLSELCDINNNTKVENINAHFISDLIHEGIMGIDWIGKVITIDIANKRIYSKK